MKKKTNSFFMSKPTLSIQGINVIQDRGNNAVR